MNHINNNQRREQRVIKNELNIFDVDNIKVNKIYKAFELIGIYSIFQGNNAQFHLFYEAETINPRYRNRNRGIDIIYKRLCKSIASETNNIEFEITKRSLKRTGICFVTTRVYEGTDLIVKAIIDYFREDNYLFEFYINHIHSENIPEYLIFQHDCLTRYINEHFGEKAEYFANMEKEIEKKIGI